MEGVGDSKSACSFPFGIPTAVASPASPGGAEQFEARPSQERGGGAALSSKAHLLGSRLVARGDWNWLCLSPWQLLVLRPPRASPPGKGAGKGAGLTQQLWSPAPREREAGRGGGSWTRCVCGGELRPSDSSVPHFCMTFLPSRPPWLSLGGSVHVPCLIVHPFPACPLFLCPILSSFAPPHSHALPQLPTPSSPTSFVL